MADQQALHSFSQWVAGCSGDEKQEAQTFVQKLFTAWGWEDASEAGVSFEHRIPKGGAGGGMGFADALIPGKVLIEMKQRGEELTRHFPQLQRYWFNLAPKPTYAILCNFDEFWVYDFNLQVDEPVEKLQTAQLPERWPGLAFLSKQPQTPLFGNNQVAVTEGQAKAMGHLFHELKQQAASTDEFTAQQAQRFVLQCVLCMFAEDRDMLPDRQFSLALETCREKKESTYDVLGGLFNAMNTPGVTAGGRFKGTPYFNGGLFSEIPQIDLSHEQLGQLIDSAREDWRLVRPSIFGNIFEASSDDTKRHALGQHFTSEPDILKVVRPTIIEPWETRIEAAKTIAELEQLLIYLRAYRVLDPACGSGNFLYMSYNGLKDIEATILSRIQDRLRSEKKKGQGTFGFVTTNQFFGMDTDPFAVELARVTLMIARKVAHDRLGLTEQELPLDNLDKNIVQADALFTPWPQADAIIGNPPFLGGKRVRKELGDEYVDRVASAYPDVRDSVDFCSYWFRLADEQIEDGGRAGLVATNSIREGWSRTAALDYIINRGGIINNAISTQRWSGDAKVHVSIVNWSREDSKVNWIDGQPVSRINSSLTSTVKVTDAPGLKTNASWGFQGATPVGVKHFLVSPETAKTWISADPTNASVLAPFLTADDLTGSSNVEPRRWVIDFNEIGIEDASSYSMPFEHLRASSKVGRAGNRDERSQHTWWRLHRNRGSMRRAIQREGGYFAFPRHSTWFIPLAGSPEWLPGDSTTVVAGCDFYVLGILTSATHRRWIIAQKSTLKADIRYTHTRCFATFPFPQIVSADLVGKIRRAMCDLNDYRSTFMLERDWGITELYNRYFDEPASKLRKLHDALDSLVLKAYGWGPKEDVLANLLDLNLELAEREQKGLPVVGPWDPNTDSLKQR